MVSESVWNLWALLRSNAELVNRLMPDFRRLLRVIQGMFTYRANVATTVSAASAAASTTATAAQKIGYFKQLIQMISAPISKLVQAFWATVRFFQLARDEWAFRTRREFGARCDCCKRRQQDRWPVRRARETIWETCVTAFWKLLMYIPARRNRRSVCDSDKIPHSQSAPLRRASSHPLREATSLSLRMDRGFGARNQSLSDYEAPSECSDVSYGTASEVEDSSIRRRFADLRVDRPKIYLSPAGARRFKERRKRRDSPASYASCHSPVQETMIPKLPGKTWNMPSRIGKRDPPFLSPSSTGMESWNLDQCQSADSRSTSHSDPDWVSLKTYDF